MDRLVTGNRAYNLKQNPDGSWSIVMGDQLFEFGGFPTYEHAAHWLQDLVVKMYTLGNEGRIKAALAEAATGRKQ